MVRSDAIILPSCILILQIDAFVCTSRAVLYCVVVNRIIPYLVCLLHWRSDNFIQLSAFLLLRVQWSRHVQILFVVIRDVWAWGLID